MLGRKTLARLFGARRSGPARTTSVPFRRKALFEALEPRVLLSADLPGAPPPELLAQASQPASPVSLQVNPGPLSVSSAIETPAEWTSTPENVWTIDGAVAGNLVGGANDRDTFVIGPDATVSGVIGAPMADRRVT